MYYETEDMRIVRALLRKKGRTHWEVDTFKHCLVLLEQLGFDLIGPDKIGIPS